MKKRWSIRTYLWLLVLAVAAPCAGALAYLIAREGRPGEGAVFYFTLPDGNGNGSAAHL